MISSPILSQIHTVPSEIVLWMVIGLLTLLGVIVAAVSVWSNVRQRPPHEAPTRREFDDLKEKVSHIEGALPDMERRILAAVSASGDKISAKVEEVAKAAYEGRQKIWTQVNSDRERIRALEARQKP